MQGTRSKIISWAFLLDLVTNMEVVETSTSFLTLVA